MMHVTFPEVVRVLERSGSSVSAAEGHGCLCGALCTTAEYPLERWLEEIVPDEESETDESGVSALRLLFTDTVRALRGDEMEFEPLIPDDEAALENRAAALAQWCQGFLYGFGTGQPVKPQQLPANVSEILKDLTHIGRAAVDVGESGEEEEQAYAEIVEYVRVGVQLIHDELADARASADSPRAS
jgi:uncharacterized protein YgfB (UPF0149 family)